MITEEKKDSTGRGVAKGVTLADVRRRAGRTQRQVAERMGVSRMRVSQIEADYPHVTFPVLLRYMDGLGGGVRFAVPGADGGAIDADDVASDVSRAEAQENRRERVRGDAGRFV